jgi:Rod binding domain-containing protein
MDGKSMANNEEELKKEVARLHRQYEAEIPRLTDLSVAVIGAFESNDASATEVSAVCLDLMLQAMGHIFGDTKADIMAEGISQLLTQLSDEPLAKELFKQKENQERPN